MTEMRRKTINKQKQQRKRSWQEYVSQNLHGCLVSEDSHIIKKREHYCFSTYSNDLSCSLLIHSEINISIDTGITLVDMPISRT